MSVSSTTNLRYLIREQLAERLDIAQNHKREALKKIVKSSKIVAASIEQEGATLGGENHNIVNEILNETFHTFAEETPQFLLWQQQKKEASDKDSRRIRWHGLIIRWCLSIYHTFPAAYKQLANRKINFLRLPQVNTSNKYSNFTKSQTGFNPDILKELVLGAGLEKIPECKKECCNFV